MPYKNSLEKAKNFADIFHIVKKIAKNYLGKDQAGLLVGLSDLGVHGHAFLGAFYSLDANAIIINKRPLDNIKENKPSLHNSYVFHIILHEYLHSLGLFEEEEVRLLAYEITKEYLGQNHLATQMALDMGKFLPNLTLGEGFEAPEDINIEFLHGIDRDNTNYIM
ncbi:hypothetical protein ISS07_02650 [Candidatus Woesearchaeota archaeon]|nr:hypothetical protein [Candidatus Woesearchaeota archaeon]